MSVLINPRYHSLRQFHRQPVFRLLLVLFLIWDSLHILGIYSLQIATAHLPPPPRNSRRIYIACQHWNNARLLRAHWNNALLSLVQQLGVENVFVTIYESGSYDDTKDALRELDASLEELKVRRDITLSDVTHADEIAKQPTIHGWIETPAGDTELRRIPFLANLRNKVLEPLYSLTSGGEQFDTILFLNDVVFTPNDVLRLLDTNQGDYAAACSLDFSKPPYYYDTFALRDVKGHETVMQTWPYFRSHASRYAAERFLPVPVSSCWNGMVAMPIDPFLGDDALQFRGIPDSLATHHLEGSECCLIHADNPLSLTRGVFLNPNVKVGYNGSSYDAVHSEAAHMSPFQVYAAVWKSRLLRWITSPVIKEFVVYKRVRRWMKGTDNYEPGEFCLVNEMQVIMERGWKHV